MPLSLTLALPKSETALGLVELPKLSAVLSLEV